MKMIRYRDNRPVNLEYVTSFFQQGLPPQHIIFIFDQNNIVDWKFDSQEESNVIYQNLCINYTAEIDSESFENITIDDLVDSF